MQKGEGFPHARISKTTVWLSFKTVEQKNRFSKLVLKACEKARKTGASATFMIDLDTSTIKFSINAKGQTSLSI